jgi:ATP-binding cassette subfamily F protein 3
VFEFRERNIRQYIGDIYDFLESRKLRSLKELEEKSGKSSAVSSLGDISDSKQLYERKKQLERDIRKVSGQVEKCEDEIHLLENKLSSLNDRLADPSKLQKGEDVNQVYQKYTALKSELDLQFANWEKLSTELESLKESRSGLA